MGSSDRAGPSVGRSCTASSMSIPRRTASARSSAASARESARTRPYRTLTMRRTCCATARCSSARSRPSSHARGSRWARRWPPRAIRHRAARGSNLHGTRVEPPRQSPRRAVRPTTRRGAHGWGPLLAAGCCRMSAEAADRRRGTRGSNPRLLVCASLLLAALGCCWELLDVGCPVRLCCLAVLSLCLTAAD